MGIKTKFNTGGTTTTDLTEQFNDHFWSKGAKREAMRKRTFTQLGDRLSQPKHYGDEIQKERHVPIFHPLNKIDGGIDATTATLLQNEIYVYTDGALSATFTPTSDMSSLAVELRGTIEGAKALAEEAKADILNNNSAAVVTFGQSAGSLFNGDANYSVIKANFPTLDEEGGNVNEVNAKSIVMKAKVSEFGLHTKFTQRAIDMDSRTGVLAQKTKDLGEAKGDVYEAQVQSDLIAAGEANRVFTGTASSIATIDDTSVLTYADLRLMEQALKKALVPRDTKVITGSTKIGTKVVGKAYYVYVGPEMYATLQDMVHTVGSTEIKMWEPVESYMDAAGSNIAEGEIGRIGGFRFIEVDNMQKRMGEGADLDATTSGTPVANFHESNGKFDVFNVLFVGSDSFATVGFEGDSARIVTAMPKADAHNDPFGKNGSMSISWYYGTLIYRPERIQLIQTAAKIA